MSKPRQFRFWHLSYLERREHDLPEEARVLIHYDGSRKRSAKRIFIKDGAKEFVDRYGTTDEAVLQALWKILVESGAKVHRG